MATQQEYTVVANALIKELNNFISTLPGFEQGMVRNYLTTDKINAGAGAAAKTAVDSLDAFRAEKQAHAASYHAAMTKGQANDT